MQHKVQNSKSKIETIILEVTEEQKNSLILNFRSNKRFKTSKG